MLKRSLTCLLAVVYRSTVEDICSPGVSTFISSSCLVLSSPLSLFYSYFFETFSSSSYFPLTSSSHHHPLVDGLPIQNQLEVLISEELQLHLSVSLSLFSAQLLCLSTHTHTCTHIETQSHTLDMFCFAI